MIFTDRNGLFDSAIGREKTNLLDEYKSNITTNGDGEMELSNDIVAQMEVVGLFSQVGVWFGEGEPTDSDGALLYGNYLLEEIRCKNNTGYKLIERSISIIQ